jgi:hypothetical protein
MFNKDIKEKNTLTSSEYEVLKNGFEFIKNLRRF